MHTRTALLAVACVISLGSDAIAQEAAAPASSLPELFTAIAINMGTIQAQRGPRNTIMTFGIDRWSTDEERATMRQAFAEKGQDGLLKALQKSPKVGYMRASNTLGWDLHYAIQVPAEDGGRRIIVGTDRRLGMFEIANNTRTADYPFTIVELHLDKDSKGEGAMSVATKIQVSKDGTHLELENYSSEPVRLQKVKKEK